VTTTHDNLRIQFLEANIARLQKALEDAEGAQKDLFEKFIEEGQRTLKRLKRHAWH
jgi:hypothetical protein